MDFNTLMIFSCHGLIWVKKKSFNKYQIFDPLRFKRNSMAFQGLSKNESLTLQGSNNNSPGRSPGYRYR